MLCGCVGEMCLCVICIFLDFVVLLGLLEFGANTQIIHFTLCLLDGNRMYESFGEVWI